MSKDLVALHLREYAEMSIHLLLGFLEWCVEIGAFQGNDTEMKNLALSFMKKKLVDELE